MNESNANRISVPHNELYQKICSYLICTDSSLLSNAAVEIDRAVRFSLPLTITGEKNNEYRKIIKVIKSLGIDYTEIEFSSEIKRRSQSWVNEPDDMNIRILVPTLKDRSSDIGLFISFYLHAHLSRIWGNSPDFEMPKIDLYYVLLIWHHYFDRDNDGLSFKLFQDLLKTEMSPILSAEKYGVPENRTMTNLHKLISFSENALQYLGFTSDAQLAGELLKNTPMYDHIINEKHREYLVAASFSRSRGNISYEPWIIKSTTYNIDFLPLVIENIYKLNLPSIFPISDKAKECLVYRLKGLSEKEISNELGFEHLEIYLQFLNDNYISIQSIESQNPFQLWLDSNDYFGFEPDFDLEEIEKSDEISHINNHKSKFINNIISEIKCSYDFRSVSLPSGEKLSLTPKQASVLQILYNAMLNKTPELSQGTIIQEIYGDVKTNRLKKLFNNDRTWDKLFESGLTKGSLKLRDKFN